MDFEIPTEAKELDFIEFGNTDNTQKSDLFILLCQQKPKVGYFSLISQQSQKPVLYFVASNSCQTLLYIPRKAVIYRSLDPLLGRLAIGVDLSWI